MQTPSPEHHELPEYVCPNCRHPYESIPELCPHCGFNIMRVPRPAFLLGSYPADVILALLVCIVCVPMIFTMLIPLVWFFAVDRVYTAIRTGLKIGLILYVVLFLGALAVCFSIGH